MADAIRQIGVSEVTYYRWRQEFGGLKIEQVKRLKELELENNRLRKAVSDLTLDKLILQEVKLLSPARRACIEQVRAQLYVSERRACAALGQHRSTQRKVPRGRDDEERLTADIIEFARQYGRYGYRKVAELLRQAGWIINDKRVERIWRREGLKVPHRQPKRGRLWLADGSCIRLRPQHRNHVWSYDFVDDRPKWSHRRGPLHNNLATSIIGSPKRSTCTGSRCESNCKINVDQCTSERYFAFRDGTLEAKVVIT